VRFHVASSAGPAAYCGYTSLEGVEYTLGPNDCNSDVADDFSPTAGLAGGLGSAGLTHAQFTVDLVQRALARGDKGRLGGVRVGTWTSPSALNS